MLWKLCKTFQKLPNDPFIVNMDEVHKLFMYFSILEDEKEHAELLKSQGLFIGAFSNPEMASKMNEVENNTFSSTDDEFDQASSDILSGKYDNFNIINEDINLKPIQEHTKTNKIKRKIKR